MAVLVTMVYPKNQYQGRIARITHIRTYNNGYFPKCKPFPYSGFSMLIFIRTSWLIMVVIISKPRQAMANQCLPLLFLFWRHLQQPYIELKYAQELSTMNAELAKLQRSFHYGWVVIIARIRWTGSRFQLTRSWYSYFIRIIYFDFCSDFLLVVSDETTAHHMIPWQSCL